MKIEVDYDNLKNVLAAFINSISCFECPYYDKCDGTNDCFDCAELFINQITKE